MFTCRSLCFALKPPPSQTAYKYPYYGSQSPVTRVNGNMMWISGFCQRFCTASFLKNPEEEREKPRIKESALVELSRSDPKNRTRPFLTVETCPILLNKDGSAIGMATEAWLLAEAEKPGASFYVCFGRKRSNCSDLATPS